jgi:hypothetical protein
MSNKRKRVLMKPTYSEGLSWFANHPNCKSVENLFSFCSFLFLTLPAPPLFCVAQIACNPDNLIIKVPYQDRFNISKTLQGGIILTKQTNI